MATFQLPYRIMPVGNLILTVQEAIALQRAHLLEELFLPLIVPQVL
jgi:hypothetical protein